MDRRAGPDFIGLNARTADGWRWDFVAASVREALEKRELRVIGHGVLSAVRVRLSRVFAERPSRKRNAALRAFAAVGAAWMNLHPDRHAPFHDAETVVQRNLQSVRECCQLLETRGWG